MDFWVDEIHYINNNKKRIQLKIHVGKKSYS